MISTVERISSADSHRPTESQPAGDIILVVLHDLPVEVHKSTVLQMRMFFMGEMGDELSAKQFGQFPVPGKVVLIERIT